MSVLSQILSLVKFSKKGNLAYIWQDQVLLCLPSCLSEFIWSVCNVSGIVLSVKDTVMNKAGKNHWVCSLVDNFRRMNFIQIHSANGHKCWRCQKVSFPLPASYWGDFHPIPSEDGDMCTLVEKLYTHRMCMSLSCSYFPGPKALL